MAAKDAAQEVLAREIIEDGRKRAAQIMADAKAEAEKLLAQADAQAGAEAAKISAESEERSRKRTDMILASAIQESAQRKLHARDEVLREALDRARQGLNKLDGEPYRKTVLSLAMDALLRMPGESFVVRAAGLSEADCASMREALLKSMRAEGRNIAVQCSPAAAASRGVIVESADGRLRWDNTFDARLIRMKAGLQNLVAPALFGET